MQMGPEYPPALVRHQHRRDCRGGQGHRVGCRLNIATENWMLVCPKFDIHFEARSTVS